MSNKPKYKPLDVVMIKYKEECGSLITNNDEKRAIYNYYDYVGIIQHCRRPSSSKGYEHEWEYCVLFSGNMRIFIKEGDIIRKI